MITPEQVAELQPGDVVELRHGEWPEGSAVRGPLYVRPMGLCCAGFAIRWANGDPMEGLGESWTAELVSRAPRPLYVNHPRTQPVAGDIVRDTDGDAWRRGAKCWFLTGCDDEILQIKDDYEPLTLLWDGETGQVVQ